MKVFKQKHRPNNSEGEKHHLLPLKKKQRVQTHDEEYDKFDLFNAL